jgi:class 3 adenylate cyclase/tetratricopeptide (TPR) repeat protein/predicted nucleic acid-binding Zn ribbon protein
MTCSTCGAEIQPDARFCMRCGSALEKQCRVCGTVAPPDAVFCSGCGTQFDATPALPVPVEERKVVTVLYADLVGSTAAADGADPEDVRARLALYHARVRRELELVGGSVEKFIGDAIVGLFGAPLAHEDDPERALRAAFAIHDGLLELNAADPSLGLEVRIGVHTGEALVSLSALAEAGEGVAAGDVMNTGARLQAAAAPGGILVGEATYRATRDIVEYGEPVQVHARGKVEAMSAWPALALRTATERSLVAAPLVGRTEELELLRRTLGRVRRERVPQLLTIVGGPGIGKSRLIRELFAGMNGAGDAPLRLEGRTFPYGEGASFHALAEMTRTLVGARQAPADDIPRLLVDAVESVLDDADEARWVASHLRPLLGIGSEDALHGDRHREAFAAWRRWFEAVAESGPLALVFEDLHWADDALLEFVDQLVDWATNVPLLVLATARPDLLERRPSWGGGKRNAVTMSLSPLDRDASGELLTSLLHGASLPSEVEGVVLAQAGGNPLYASEYVRMLTDRGLVRRNGELGRGRELPLPESVHGIIAARIDTLPADEKTLVQNAAVVGETFWAGALAAMASLPRTVVEEHMRQLERKDFLRRERESSVAGETQYAFDHIVVRDVAYGQLPRARRAELHQLAGEWLESLTAVPLGELVEPLAHHYLSAIELGRAARRDISELRERARAAADRAGLHASALNAHAAAARFYSAALDLTDPESADRARLLLRTGEALFHAEQGGADLLEEARDALLAVGYAEDAAVADVLLATLFVNRGAVEAAQEHLERATTRVRDIPATRSTVYVLSTRARFLIRAGKPDDAIAVGREGLAMAETLGLDDLRAQALDNVGVARLARGDHGAREDFERSLAVAESIRSPETTRAYRFLASTVALEGELRPAFELFARGRRAAERFGDAFEVRWLQAALVGECYWTGRWDEAVERADEFVAAAAEGSPHYMETACRRVRSLIRLARGDDTGAGVDARRSLEIARDVNDPWHLNQALAVRARAYGTAGEAGEAANAAEELLRRWRAGGPQPAFEAFDLAVALDTLGESGEFERVPGGTPWLNAARAYARGDYATAAETLAEIGSRPDEASARLRTDDGAADAVAFFRSVGASAYASG